MNILYLASSPRGSDSYSNRVGATVVDELRRRNPGATVVTRDLARDPLPQLDADLVIATRAPGGPQTPAQHQALALSNTLVDELLAADILVIATPMINFTVPTNLKTWIDYVARAGRTFRYSEKGPEGLVQGKQAIIVAARGGMYPESAAMDFQVPYLRGVLGFMGMTDVEVLAVDGTGYGPEVAEKAVEAASAKLTARCDRLAAAA